MIRYVGVAGIAKWFGVEPKTVTKWLNRYAYTHPCPPPDAEIGDGDGAIRGWLPDREAEWRAWHASRPGRGAGGGRPRKRPA